jgi:DNA-binding SARP family transcriptional activator
MQSDALWRIELFGTLCAKQGNRAITKFRTEKAGLLLAYLAYHRRNYPRDFLSTLLWPDAEPEAGRHNLRQELSALRKTLEASTFPLFTVDKSSIGLNSDAFTTDVAEFQAALKRAEKVPSLDERSTLLYRAVDLYRNGFLPGYNDVPDSEEWVELRRAAFEQDYQNALYRLMETLEQAGDLRGALEIAERAVERDALRASSHVLRLSRLVGDTPELRRLTARMKVLLKELLDDSEQTAAYPELSDLFAQLHTLGYQPSRRETSAFQKALEAAFSQLSPEARQVLLTLSVFPSTFNGEAAQAVSPVPDTAQLLAVLHAGGFLIQSEERSALPIAIKEFVACRLSRRERRKSERAFADHYAGMLKCLKTANSPHMPVFLKAEHLNLIETLRLRVTDTRYTDYTDNLIYRFHANVLCPETIAFQHDIRAWLEKWMESPRLSPVERSGLIRLRGYCETQSGRHENSIPYYLRAARMAPKGPAQENALVGLIHQGYAYHQSEMDVQAQELFTETVALARKNCYFNLCISALFGLAEVLRTQGRVREAQQMGREATQLAQEHNHISHYAFGRFIEAQIAIHFGDYGHAMRELDAFRQLLRQYNPHSYQYMGDSLRYMGYIHSEQGCLTLAQDEIEQALEIYTRENLVNPLMAGKLDLAVLRSLQGQTDTAREILQECLAYWHEKGHARWRVFCLSRLAQVELRAGNIAEVISAAQEALALLEKTRSPLAQTRTLNALGVARLRCGDYAEAEVRFGQALSISSEMEYTRGRAEALEGFGLLSGRTGNYDQSVKYLGEADSLRESMDIPRRFTTLLLPERSDTP